MIDDSVSNPHQKFKHIACDSFEDTQDEISILPVEQRIHDGWDAVHMSILLGAIETDGWLVHVIVDAVIVSICLIFPSNPFLKVTSEPHPTSTDDYLNQLLSLVVQELE